MGGGIPRDDRPGGGEVMCIGHAHGHADNNPAFTNMVSI